MCKECTDYWRAQATCESCNKEHLEVEKPYWPFCPDCEAAKQKAVVYSVPVLDLSHLPLVGTIGNGVTVKPSLLPHAGNGLFTLRRFLKNELITEYCGKRISWEEACQLRCLGKHSHIRKITALHEAIDGLREPVLGQGGASFANDDPDKINAVFTGRFDHGTAMERVYLKATRDLEADEEVYVSYGEDYWDAMCDSVGCANLKPCVIHSSPFWS